MVYRTLKWVGFPWQTVNVITRGYIFFRKNKKRIDFEERRSSEDSDFEERKPWIFSSHLAKKDPWRTSGFIPLFVGEPPNTSLESHLLKSGLYHLMIAMAAMAISKRVRWNKNPEIFQVPAQVNVLALSFYSHLLGNHVVPSSSQSLWCTHYTSLWISWCHETCSHRHISSYLRNHYWKLPEVMNWWFHQAKG